MNITDNNDSDQAIKKLYRATRSEQPSLKVDARIRKEALNQVNQFNNKQRIRRSRLTYFSTAALVVLSVSLVINVSRQPELTPPEIVLDSPAVSLPEVHKKRIEKEESTIDSVPVVRKDARDLEQSNFQEKKKNPGQAQQPAVNAGKPALLKQGRTAPQLLSDSSPEMSITEDSFSVRRATRSASQRMDKSLQPAPRLLPEPLSESATAKAPLTVKRALKPMSQMMNKNRIKTRQDNVQSADIAGARAPVSEKYFLQTEKLPFNTQALQRTNKNMSIKPVKENRIEVYIDNKLILSLQREDQLITASAWQGSEIYGIQAPWHDYLNSTEACSLQKAVFKCPLTEEVTAGYKNRQLIFIEWQYSF